MMLSLRTRLLGGIIIAMAVLLAVFSVVVYTITHQTMIQHFDKSLLATAQMLSAVIEEEGIENESEGEHEDESQVGSENQERGIDFEFDVRMTPEFSNLNGGAYYQIWNRAGKTLVRSPSLGLQNLSSFGHASDVPQYREAVLPDGMRGRAISYPFLPRTEESQGDQPEDRLVILVLAQNTAPVDDHLAFLKWLLLGSSAGVVFLSTGIAFLVTKAGLRPIHSLAGRITSVREDNLGRLFPSEAYPPELSPICTCLNEAFQRLEASFQRERQFNANVAHELRTPLAGMLSTIEVCLTRERESTEYKDAIESCLHIAKTMNKMIDTLLSLSKLESGQMSVKKESVHVKDLIDETWRYFADKAYDKGIVFENSIQQESLCRSDKDRLIMILSNILDNAVEYADEGGRIQTHLERADDVTIVSISNTGCALTMEDVEHVFEFFWRKSSSRTDAGKHCGIGLPVARKIAAVLDIGMDIDIHDDVFVVHLRISNKHE